MLGIEHHRPESVLAKGNHLGFEWRVCENGNGHRCGYVEIPKGHPFYGKGYDESDLYVHGGITYADRGVGTNSWWLGFDCAHSGDAQDPSLPGYAPSRFPAYGVIRTTEYVQEECEGLCRQASEAASKQAAATAPAKGQLEFTLNEQNCLSLLCQAMSAASHQLNGRGKSLLGAHVEAIEDVLERFPNINWGDLYDRFHRQGLNRN